MIIYKICLSCHAVVEEFYEVCPLCGASLYPVEK